VAQIKEVEMKRALICVAIVGVLGVAWSPPAKAQVVQTVLDPVGIPKFVNNLPMLSLEPDKNGNWKGDIPVLDSRDPEAAEKFLSICEFKAQILPEGTVDTVTQLLVPLETWVWGYQIGQVCQPFPKHSYIGPVVVAERGTATQLTFINQLGEAPLSMVPAYSQNTDQTMHWADVLNGEYNFCAHQADLGYLPTGECLNNYAGPIAAAVHLHGGEVPPQLDGGPDSWFSGVPDPANTGAYYRGHGYYTREVNALPTLPNADFPPGVMVWDRATEAHYRNDLGSWTETTAVDRATFVYPNTQEAANIWFHDHILGMTRLNVYAGIAGAYVITEPGATNEDLGPVTNLVPLVIQDRTFDTNGQLWFGAGGATPEHPFWVPEFIGDVIVVNGAAWPNMIVEPKRYRFLFLNGSNARGYDIFNVIPTPAGDLPGPDIWVIGTDGGYLDTPVKVNHSGAGEKLVLLPGERYEVIIDFTNFASTFIEMRNSAGTPYPLGAPVTLGGTDTIMQFEVKGKAKSPGIVYDPAAVPPAPLRTDSIIPLNALTPAVKRQLTLNEVDGLLAPREALLNNTKWHGMQIIEGDPSVATPNSVDVRDQNDFTLIDYNGVPTYYSELPAEGDFEVWEIINITADAHPIHLHLVQFQILGREPIDTVCYTNLYDAAFMASGYLGYMPGYGPPNYYGSVNGDGAIGGNPAPSTCYLPPNTPGQFGPSRGPEPFEAGWKDTAVAYPGEVTRLAVRWAPTDVPAGDTEGFPFVPDEGHGYVWHCHILDHEDSEMMRPTKVESIAEAPRTFIKGVHY
jgi:FtsP/CotA-like multicopper oxidase with cupredoxin domain